MKNLLACVFSLLFVPVLSAEERLVTVTPQETDEILANPGVGWQTFHRTSKQDKSLPSWIPSTLHYARWGWGELEPQPGKLNTQFLDRVLRETRDAGQQLAFRVMCCSARWYHRRQSQVNHKCWRVLRMPSDEELMRAVAGGDLSAFGQLVTRHQAAAWNTA